jgi:hypothetical protein
LNWDCEQGGKEILAMKIVNAIVAGLALAGGVCAQKPPLLAEKDVAAIAGEISGETAKRNSGGDCEVSPAAGVEGIS